MWRFIQIVRFMFRLIFCSSLSNENDGEACKFDLHIDATAIFNSRGNCEWDLTIDALHQQHQIYPSHLHYQCRIPRQWIYIVEKTIQIYYGRFAALSVTSGQSMLKVKPAVAVGPC